MKKFLPFTAFIFLCQLVYAQSAIDGITGNFSSDLVYSVHGKSATNSYESIKKGTPFFINDWLPSTIILFNGKQFDQVPAKMDMLGHKLFYKEKGVEYEAESSVKEVILLDAANGKEHRFVHASAFPNPVQKDENGWYLALVNGDVSAYKYISKKVEESRQYSSAIKEKSIETNEKFFIYNKNVLLPVKRLRDITDILRDKQAELNEYIKQESLKKVSDESIKGLIAYYNSLLKN